LAQIRQEKCHASTKEHDYTKVTANLISKLHTNSKRLASTIGNVQNYNLERRLQKVVAERKELSNADKREILTSRDSKPIIKASKNICDGYLITKQERDLLFLENPTQEHLFKDEVMRLSVVGSQIPTFKDYERIVKD
jgi:hypothetical protein